MLSIIVALTLNDFVCVMYIQINVFYQIDIDMDMDMNMNVHTNMNTNMNTNTNMHMNMYIVCEHVHVREIVEGYFCRQPRYILS
jgi:hypothetical protein